MVICCQLVFVTFCCIVTYERFLYCTQNAFDIITTLEPGGADRGALRRTQLKLAALYMSERRDDLGKVLREVVGQEPHDHVVHYFRQIVQRSRAGMLSFRTVLCGAVWCGVYVAFSVVL